MKKPLPCLPTVLILFSTVFAHEEAGSNPAKSITRTELKDHVYFLASDEMAGRAITTDEFRTAALYCATQFQQAGLKPIKGDGDNTSFLQEVPFVKKTLGAAGMLMVENETTLHRFDATAETRYLMQADTRVFSQARPIVFAGYGICAPEHGWNDFDGLEIDGKIVVILAGAPRHGAPGILPADMFEKLN